MNRSYRVVPNVRFRLVDGEAVVVRQKMGDVLVLNGVGARVLQLVGEGLTPAEIRDRVTNEYDAPAARIRNDVEAFFGELEGLEVIEPLPSSGETP